MRYIPAYCLTQGMLLAKSIYSEDGVVLLAKDVALTDEYVQSIHKLGINGAYIEDAISKNIYIENVISEEFRVGAVKSIKRIFNNSNGISKSIHKIEFLAKNIMEEVLRTKSVMVNMVDVKTYDNYMYTHSVNVAVLCSVIGIALNLEEKKLQKLATSALLHDVGKLFIPKEILSKKEEELTEGEMKIYKTHPEKGYRYIKDHHNVSVTSYVGILQHHERFDGKGYPDGKSGEGISEFARIISVCDLYDNLLFSTSDGKSRLPSEAIEYIMANSGIILDPKIVKLFLRKVAPYPLGSIVGLSNGERAIVIENNEECSIRPKVKILDSEKIYELTTDWNTRNITIVSVEN